MRSRSAVVCGTSRCGGLFGRDLARGLPGAEWAGESGLRCKVKIRLSPHLHPAASASGAAPVHLDQRCLAGLGQATRHMALMQVALQQGAYLAQGTQPSGGLSHAEAGRDARRCHPGGDGARGRRYRDGLSAEPHGVGQGAENGRARWRPCAPRFPPLALALRRCGYRNGRLTW